MPYYDYRCKNCGAELEVQQKITEEALVECPECDNSTLRRVIKPTNVIYKGSGFYQTDRSVK